MLSLCRFLDHREWDDDKDTDLNVSSGKRADQPSKNDESA